MREAVTVALITLAGLAVRIWTADWGGLSADEANGVAIALSGTWRDMVEHLKEDGNPPLFYVLLRLFAAAFGGGDLALRALSVIMSAAVVPAVYMAARALLGKRVAEQAALLAALCPPLLRFGTMVRMYWLLPLLGLASMLAALKLLESPRSWRWRLSYVVATALMIYCHHWGFIAALGQACLALLGWLRRWWRLASLLGFLACLTVAVLCYLPWLPVLTYTLSHDESPWALSPALTHLVIETPAEMLTGRLKLKDAWEELGIIYAGFWAGATFLLCAAGMGAAAARARQSGEAARSASLLRYAVVLGLVGALVLSSFKPAWRDRYLVAFTPVVLMLFCATVQPFTARLKSGLALCIPALLWLPFWAPQLVWLDRMPESSAWAISEKIREEADPDADLVIVSWEAVAPAITRALPEKIPVVSFPALDRVEIIKWDGINERLRDESRMQQLLSRMDSVLDKGGTVWLVDSTNAGPAVLPGAVSLDPLHFLEVEQIRMDQIRTWLRINAKQQESFIWAPGRDVSMFLSIYARPPDWKPAVVVPPAVPPAPLDGEGGDLSSSPGARARP